MFFLRTFLFSRKKIPDSVSVKNILELKNEKKMKKQKIRLNLFKQFSGEAETYLSWVFYSLKNLREELTCINKFYLTQSNQLTNLKHPTSRKSYVGANIKKGLFVF